MSSRTWRYKDIKYFLVSCYQAYLISLWKMLLVWFWNLCCLYLLDWGHIITVNFIVEQNGFNFLWVFVTKSFFWISLERHLRNRIYIAGKLSITTFVNSGRLANNTAGVFSNLKQGSKITYLKHASQMVEKIWSWSSVSLLNLFIAIHTYMSTSTLRVSV